MADGGKGEHALYIGLHHRKDGTDHHSQDSKSPNHRTPVINTALKNAVLMNTKDRISRVTAFLLRRLFGAAAP